MKSQETARKLMAEGRLKAEEVEEKMLERAEEELSTGNELDEQARELLAHQRQEEQLLEKKMLTRTQEQMNE